MRRYSSGKNEYKVEFDRARGMTEMKQRDSKVGPKTVTPHERAILRLIAEGYKCKEIGDRLNISEKQIKEKQIRIMRKLNARSITSVLEYALRKGLISLYEILESRFSKRKLEANW
jgi:DNA-binding NarL/FixJ family response regulator